LASPVHLAAGAGNPAGSNGAKSKVAEVMNGRLPVFVDPTLSMFAAAVTSPVGRGRIASTDAIRVRG
jgi:hypothetical protein